MVLVISPIFWIAWFSSPMVVLEACTAVTTRLVAAMLLDMLVVLTSTSSRECPAAWAVLAALSATSATDWVNCSAVVATLCTRSR